MEHDTAHARGTDAHAEGGAEVVVVGGSGVGAGVRLVPMATAPPPKRNPVTVEIPVRA
jgi:hypothetical protein